MLDWLKTILGDHYTDEIDKKVSEEIGKGFVARADFNAANEAKKQLTESVGAYKQQLADLTASSGDAEALKKQIADLQQQNAARETQHAADMKKLRIEGAVDMALSAAKAKNPKAVKALLDMTDAELAKDGSVKGLSDQLKKLMEAPDSNFLFDASTAPAFSGMTPAEGGDKATPAGGKKTSEMGYDELCAYLEKNPNAKLE